MSTFLYIAAALAALFIVIALIRSGHFLRCLLFSVVTGNVTLLVISYLGAFTGVTLGINLFTVGTASLLGIPGVLAMLLIRLLFSV